MLHERETVADALGSERDCVVEIRFVGVACASSVEKRFSGVE